MDYSTRGWRRLRGAAVLFMLLAITTGWAQAAQLTASGGRPSAGHLAGDEAPARQLHGGGATDSGPQGRVARPGHVLPAPVEANDEAPAAVAVAHAFSGKNHFWIPSLGISREVYAFPCSRKRAPDNLIYRWGCAGTNNVYILGHAYGVMKPLHDAYVSGRLRVGMLAIYADGNGFIRSYRVTAWQVVSPTESRWAIASQPVPSMTLQTCVGARSQWRLDVRLVAVD
jgi:hypothetical protein